MTNYWHFFGQRFMHQEIILHSFSLRKLPKRKRKWRKIISHLFLTFSVVGLNIFLSGKYVLAQTAPWNTTGAKDCLGFMCGPAIVATLNDPFKDYKSYILGMFLATNLVIMLVFAWMFFKAIQNYQSGQDWITIVTIIVLGFLGLWMFNALGGVVFGIG